LKEASHLKTEQRYKQAKEAYRRGGDKLGEHVVQLYIDLQEMLEMFADEDLKHDKTEFAKNFFDCREYEKAKDLFNEIGDGHGVTLAQKCAGQVLDKTKVRKAINGYSRFGKEAFINIGDSDYIDVGNAEIAKLIAEVKQLKVG
jgi:hypothetical protein